MATTYNTNLSNVVTQYLKLLKVNVTETTLKKQLQQNPFYPSLYSISNTLNKLKVPNEAFNVSDANLNEFQVPFIAYCNGMTSGKDFVLITSVSQNEVAYISNSKKETIITRANFLKIWQQIILIAEPDVQSGENNYSLNLKIEQSAKRKKQLLLTGILLTVVMFVSSLLYGIAAPLIPFASMISCTKLIGLGITLLLLAYEVDKSNTFIKSLCTAGKQTNCDAVLNSKASGIAGVKWSEAGFFYFAASTLFLFFPGITFFQKIPWLAIGATAVAPYIVFSIYYQYKIVKQWCPLCLSTQVVLFIELVWAGFTFWQHPSWPIADKSIIIAALISLLLPVVLWFYIKPLLKKQKDASTYEAAYKRLLYNPDQFNQLLQQQAEAPDGWQQLGITIGNPNAANTILKICNPYCGPCAKAHPELEAIIHNNDTINLKIVFTASNSENDRGAKPVRHLLAIASNNNVAQTKKALDDWYSANKKDYDSFALKYPMNGELKKQEEKITAMNDWCQKAGITATPTIFINGHQLPENYNISELKEIF